EPYPAEPLQAANRELRMTDLAAATGRSASRTKRLVEDLQARGLAKKRPSATDGRGFVARLTAGGLTGRKAAWPVHPAGVHRRAFDHIDANLVADAAQAIWRIAAAPDC